MNKGKIPNSSRDTAKNCQALAKEYDLSISESISADKELGIEQLLELPFIISQELCETGTIDEITRRFVFGSKIVSNDPFWIQNCIIRYSFGSKMDRMIQFRIQNCIIRSILDPKLYYTIYFNDFGSEIVFFRFLDVLVQVYVNFWTETKDNTHYKAVYMVFEAIRALKPHDWFCLPNIQLKLEECARNESNYLLWGKGNGFILQVLFSFLFIYW